MNLDYLKREVVSKVCDKVEDVMHYRGAEEMFDYLASRGVIQQWQPNKELKELDENGLIPCPFCGGDAFRDDGNSDYVNVCCSNDKCDLSTIFMSPISWNTRTALTTQRSEVYQEPLKELNWVEAMIRQKKGFYAVSVGHDPVKIAHKAGINKGLDASHEIVKQAIARAKQKGLQNGND